ncbi:fatty-acid-binding protein 3, chloroplastic isoform X1 [Capsicum chacoense]|uniref:Chalcone-flavonone isomerase family protein n=1 Tax=Capsicum annuum TaxID=4072 RepID=A0A2G2Z4P2_CAPAN|nr:fatty-acid-binding protein 3, chloroplastic isoform X1 [Capsicum annuum]KAF3676933.1 Fatty-acid-binding protein 3 [Capsicum annuum]PHT76990.1 Fatty-acid-binding protein 3 [Capsicum annuum]
MTAAGAISVPLWISTSTPPTKIIAFNNKLRICYPVKLSRNGSYPLSTFEKNGQYEQSFTLKVASSSSVGSTEEPATKVKFQRSLSLPGSSTSLSLLGTGYREKVFAIIGIKVYAAGLYVNDSVFSRLDAWRGRSAAEIQQDPSLFNNIFEANLEKSLLIVLVRDIDGKTFWDALDEAISPRIKSPTADDKSALSTFRDVFQGKPLKKETSIFLTWIDPTKMLVSLSFDGMPSSVDATIESTNVASALFDVFLGGDPVSPTLKASVAKGLEAALK